MAQLLEIENLFASYGEGDVLHGVSLSLLSGQCVAVLGANGAGKTTLLRSILRATRTRGVIRHEGNDVSAFTTDAMVRLGFAHVPDGRGTFSGLTVDENIAVGAITRRNRAEIARDTDEMYSCFPRLKERRRQLAGTLSGGEQQMLAVARALMLRPKLMLLDEPSFGLAPKIVEEIFAIFRRIRSQAQVAILLVEQNANLALDFADHAYLLETGRVVLSGPVANFKLDKTIRRSYLGV
jgi:branched-chain amino acid transport system ATP-binding protein